MADIMFGSPCMGKSPQSETGILLIEDEDGNTRLSWVAGTREVKQKDSLYNRVVSALQRKNAATRKTSLSSRQTPDCLS